MRPLAPKTRQAIARECRAITCGHKACVRTKGARSNVTTMTAPLHTQWVLAYAITAGDSLARTAPNGNVTVWPVLDVTRHPSKLDHVLISGDAGRGLINAHLGEWVQRIVP